jgi:phospholipid/cholesterol/gamma-HCH transport system substrate-binding protein
VKRFRERSRAKTGLVGMAATLGLMALALEYPRLPLIHSVATYNADFSDAGGLITGDIVTVDGVKIGTITNMTLEGDFVDVTFTVSPGVDLGSTTSAAAKVLSPVGTEYMELTVSGPGTLTGTIPEARTSVPYNLVTDLSGLGTVIQQYDIPELEQALHVAGQDLSSTSASQTTSAFDGLAELSTTIGDEQSALADIVSQGAGLTSVLSSRSSQLFDLFGQANLVLSVLQQRSTAIHQLLAATASLGAQIDSVLTVNHSQLTSLLQSLKSVSAVLAKDADDFAGALPVLAAFSRYAANSTGSGPFADVAVPTLLIPDNVAVQCSTAGAFPSSNSQVGCRP